MAGRNNGRSGLRVLWIPGKKRHHHKDKFYRPTNEKTILPQRETRFNDSPYSRRKHQEDPILNPSEHPLPHATTSATVSVAGTSTLPNITDVVLDKEDTKDQEEEDDDDDVCTDSEDKEVKNSTAIKKAVPKSKTDNLSHVSQETLDQTCDDESEIHNSLISLNNNRSISTDHLDRTDSITTKCKKKKHKKKKTKQETKEDEDECGIKCLYYAQQCCECVIS